MKKALKNKLLALAAYTYARLQEASTIRGLVILGATLLCSNQPENIDAIVTVAATLVGVIGVVFPDIAKRSNSN